MESDGAAKAADGAARETGAGPGAVREADPAKINISAGDTQIAPIDQPAATSHATFIVKQAGVHPLRARRAQFAKPVILFAQ